MLLKFCRASKTINFEWNWKSILPIRTNKPIKLNRNPSKQTAFGNSLHRSSDPSLVVLVTDNLFLSTFTNWQVVSATQCWDETSLSDSIDRQLVARISIQLRERAQWSRLATTAATSTTSLSFSPHRSVVKRCWSKLHAIFYCQPPQQIISLTQTDNKNDHCSTSNTTTQ